MDEFADSQKSKRSVWHTGRLDAWGGEERCQRAVLGRAIVKGLGAAGRGRGRERERLREELADAPAVGAQAAAVEGGRRKTARLGVNVAETRAGGLHQVGA